MAVDEPSCSEIAINPAGSDRLDTEQIKVAIKVELDEGDEADDGGGAKTDARSLAEQQAREHMQRMIREAEEQTREELERKAARAKMRDAEIASLTASLTVIEARNDSLPSIFGVENPAPALSRSTMKPRMTPSSFAHTTAISAIGAFEIHILAPLR